MEKFQLFFDEEFYALLAEYWQIRDSKEPGETRSNAHNSVLDAFSARGIQYEDREHAAQLAKEFLRVRRLIGYLLNEIGQFVEGGE